MKKTDVFIEAVKAGGKLTVKSALNPALWLCGIISIPSLVALVIITLNWFIIKTNKDNVNNNDILWLQIVLYISFLLPVICCLISFFILLAYDRDKLQSEGYQLSKKQLEMSQQTGDTLPTQESPKNAVEDPEDIMENPEDIMENPEQNQLFRI